MVFGGHEREMWGPQEHPDSFEHQTNNRMEIIAAIEALRALKRPCKVRLHSDSQYVIGTMTLGWSRGKNKDLWDTLDEAANRHEVEWAKVKTHEGRNLRCHALVGMALRRNGAA